MRRANIVEARRTRAERARRQVGEERLRIARELHDVVAHHMSLINVQAGVALHLVDRKPEQVETALATIKDASKEALIELRALIGVLRADGEDGPAACRSRRLASLDDLVGRTRQAGVELQARVEGDTSGLPAAVELAAYRIIQEAVTNIVRHSGARSATCRVVVGDDGGRHRDRGRRPRRSHPTPPTPHGSGIARHARAGAGPRRAPSTSRAAVGGERWCAPGCRSRRRWPT